MAVMVMQDFPNKPRSASLEDRIARLRATSEAQTENLRQQCVEIDNRIAHGDIPPCVLEDPELANMTQYAGDGSVITGANVSQFQQTPQNYSSMPQNAYSPQVFRGYVADYGVPMVNTMYQPQYGANIINTAPAYNQYYQQPIQYNYRTTYYQPNNYYYGGGIYSPYMMDPELVKEIEEMKLRQAKTNATLSKFFKRFANLENPEYDEKAEAEYCRQVDNLYGFEENDDVRHWVNLFNTFIQRNKQSSQMDLIQRGQVYDQKGMRQTKINIRVGLSDENGEYHSMSPQNGPEGFRIVEYSRQDDEAILRNMAHFWDPYIIADNIRNRWIQCVEQIRRKTNKFNKYSFEELIHEGRMKEYYYETIVVDDSKRIEAKMRGRNWDRERFDRILNAHPCYQNASTAFFTNYDTAKYFHALNLSKTPDELNLDKEIEDKLKKEYLDRRSIFMNRVLNGNVRANMAAGARQREVIGHDSIMDMTLDDIQKTSPNNIQVIDTPMTICGIPVNRRVIETGTMTDDELKSHEASVPVQKVDYVQVQSKPLQNPSDDIVNLF